MSTYIGTILMSRGVPIVNIQEEIIMGFMSYNGITLYWPISLWKMLLSQITSQIAKLMWPTWGQPGSCRPQMGPMLAPWTLLLLILMFGYQSPVNYTFFTIDEQISHRDKCCFMRQWFYWICFRNVVNWLLRLVVLVNYCRCWFMKCKTKQKLPGWKLMLEKSSMFYSIVF